jgi:hypothetical protein
MTSTMRFDKWENSLGQPYGTVLQVVSVTFTDIFSTTSATFVDITGLSASITPRFASSKILITGSVNISATQGTNGVRFRLARGSTGIAIGNTAGGRTRAYSGGSTLTTAMVSSAFNFLDSPSTISSVTYNVQLATNSGGSTAAVNRQLSDVDDPSIPRGVSTITLMEIAQ